MRYNTFQLHKSWGLDSCSETKAQVHQPHWCCQNAAVGTQGNAGMRWTSTGAGLGSTAHTGAGVQILQAMDLVSVAALWTSTDYITGTPRSQIDRLSFPRSLPNRYDQRGVGAVIFFPLE